MTTYFGGLVSGLDTGSMIDQLMAVERVPVQRLEARRRQLVAKDEAWQTINTRLSALRDAVDALVDRSAFDAFAQAASSRPERATVSVTGSPSPQTLSFTVDRLATRHEVVTAGGFASADAAVGAGTFTLAVDGVDHHLTTTATTTLSDLVEQVNALDAGVTASILSPDGATFELRLVSDETGAASAFTASGDQPGLTTQVVRTGQDAQLTAGSLVLTRPSNSISGLVEGVTIELVSVGTEEVTVTVGRDVDAVVEAVKTLVDELDKTATTVRDLSSYNADADKAAPLLGDATARDLLHRLLGAVSSTVSGSGDLSHAAAVGVELGRDGSVALDEAKLRQALEQDFEGVADLLSRTAVATDPRVRYVRSSDGTGDGTYQVVVTRAAQAASATSAPYVAPTADRTLQITIGGVVADATITAGSGLTAAVDAVNQALEAAGVHTIVASAQGGALVLTETRFGSSVSFEVTGSGDLLLDGIHTGEDVAGTIGGEPATGIGRLLTADSGAPAGLSLEIGATQAEVDGASGSLVLGDVAVFGGLAGAVSAVVGAAEGPGGSVDRARDLWAAQIDLVDDQIADFEARLQRVEDDLIRRFAALEQAMSRLVSQQSWLQAQLAGLSGRVG